jgi:hypothetical protein
MEGLLIKSQHLKPYKRNKQHYPHEQFYSSTLLAVMYKVRECITQAAYIIGIKTKCVQFAYF